MRSASGGLRPVEAGVETGDLRDVGQALRDCVDGRQIVRLMKRRERNQTAQLFENLGRDHESDRVKRTPPWTTRCPTPRTRAPPYFERSHTASASSAVALILHVVELHIGERARFAVLGGQPRRRADALDLAAGCQPPVFGVRPDVDAEFQARRAGVENERVISHGRRSPRVVRGGHGPPEPRRRSSRCANGRYRRGWSG